MEVVIFICSKNFFNLKLRRIIIKMDIYTKEENFPKFVLFMNKNKDQLSRDDLIQFYDGALVNTNKKVIDYLLKEHKYIIEEDYINQTMLFLTDPKYLEIIKIFNSNKVSLKPLYEKEVLKYISLLNEKYTDTIIVSYMKYIIYLLNNISNPSLGLIKEQVVYNNHNIKDIVNLIDVIILFGGNDVVIESSDDKLLFYNKDKNISDVIKGIDKFIVDIIKDEMNDQDIKTIITKLRKRNKVKYITKIKENFYVYNDTINTWCFDNNNIQYIKDNKSNPLNGDNIPEYVIKNL
jgi:hypothetical protein